MRSPDPDSLRDRPDNDLNPAMLADWVLVLGNLVPLRQIRVEIVLSRESIVRRDHTVQR